LGKISNCNSERRDPSEYQLWATKTLSKGKQELLMPSAHRRTDPKSELPCCSSHENKHTFSSNQISLFDSHCQQPKASVKQATNNKKEKTDRKEMLVEPTVVLASSSFVLVSFC
jgi:hypothetical protein